jgi:hypothetical protein
MAESAESAESAHRRAFLPSGRIASVAPFSPVTEAPTMIVEGFKQIASYVTLTIGITVTENAARKWAMRQNDPLPIERFAGRVFAHRHSLDEWIERQRGRQRAREEPT